MSKPRLLVVDDDEIVCRAMRRVCSGDYDVVTSRETISPEGFDVALIDWEPHGPEMVALCSAWSVPVVIHSGSRRDDVPGDLMFLPKPAPKIEILTALEGALK